MKGFCLSILRLDEIKVRLTLSKLLLKLRSWGNHYRLLPTRPRDEKHKARNAFGINVRLM